MTDTALKPLPEPADAKDTASLKDRAREAASAGREKVASAATATIDAAKDHPVAAAGIAAGVAAAVGGAAFAATKLAGGKTPPKRKPAAKKK